MPGQIGARNNTGFPDMPRRRAMTVFATRFFRAREYLDERLPILLKRELSQRVHRLDVLRPVKDGLAGSDGVLCELNGVEASAGWTTCQL
jgi:hypothetical protein